MSRRAAALAGTIAAAALVVAGCSADDEPSTAPPATYTSVPAPAALPSAAPSNEAGSASGEQANVKRGANTGQPGVDVLITVEYTAGKVTPPAGAVDVQVGDHVKVRVSVDHPQTVDVQGQPDKTTAVQPGAAGDIDWKVAKAGDTRVTLSGSGTALTTVHAA